MSTRRTEIWLAAGVLALGLIPAALAGLWGYMSITATPLHPNPDDSPSVMHSPSPPQWADAVELGRQSVRAALNEQNLPGLSVAVGIDGDIVWAEGFGWADLEKRVPVAPGMLFRIGTASVPLTSAAAALLLEDGRLKLDEAIQTYVPEAPEKQRRVTLRQLMGHVAGVANDGGDEGPLFSEHCERPVDALQYLSGYEVELRFEPGTQFQYSSYGWILISAAIEAQIAELESADDRAVFLAEYGLTESGLNKLIRASYQLLDLITYFTAGEKEVRAWTIKKGWKAPQAAGVIHTDFEKGFIRAEVIKLADYQKYKTESGCKEAGKMAVEGKDYTVADGDIMHFRFNV